MRRKFQVTRVPMFSRLALQELDPTDRDEFVHHHRRPFRLHHSTRRLPFLPPREDSKLMRVAPECLLPPSTDLSKVRCIGTSRTWDETKSSAIVSMMGVRYLVVWGGGRGWFLLLRQWRRRANLLRALYLRIRFRLPIPVYMPP